MADTTSSVPASQSGSSTDASPFTAPQISLPKGGGAIRGIGEKFSANPVTGTGSLSVPIAVSPGRSGFGPQLALAYDTGTGNGPFGMGWSLSLPAITRRTDKGLPQYRDCEESDVFILSGAEDLVPVLKRDREDRWVMDEFERDGYLVKRYRPRIEGLFARIERWTRLNDRDVHWRSISKDNILTVYGFDAESRIADPADPRHVFSWLICQSYDDKGNAIVYEYRAENDEGVHLSRPNERHRIRTANRYLKRISYGNRQPLLLDPCSPSFRSPHTKPPAWDTADWMFKVVFDYGDELCWQEGPDARGCVHTCVEPCQRSEASWPARRDPFSSYRSGFEVRTYRLCRRALMFHHFPEELGTDSYLVRSTEFQYLEKATGSFITHVVQSGYKRQEDGRYLKKSMPALSLSYTSSPLEDPDFQGYEAHEIDESSVANLPGGIDGANYQWVDLDGEGIAGVLTQQGDAWFYKANRGEGRFDPTQLVTPKPSLAAIGSGRQQLLDVEGDGNLDLVDFGALTPGFYERTRDAGWDAFRAFTSLPARNWSDPNLRFADITGDGIADVFITDDEALTWHPSLGKEGFGEAVRVRVPWDEEKGPCVLFAGDDQSIYLTDMSADGLADLVRIRNGQVCYWPNLGYGRFGAKVTMNHSPWFDDPDLFDQRRIRFADTDGSGTSDILYFGADGVRIFLNQSGNGWSSARTLRQFPPVTQGVSVAVVDLLGRGTACLLWSSQLLSDSQRPLTYVDLMCGKKPHLLVNVQNNLGAETVVEYATSTEFYLADKAAGRPWVTRLPFPVHVVAKVETFDHVSKNRFLTRYSYHHGHYDGIEREFRGFGIVEQLDAEQLGVLTSGNGSHRPGGRDESFSVPPVLTKTWFHTGVYPEDGHVCRHFAHEYYREGRPQLGESPLGEDQLEAMRLEDATLPGGLTEEERREAFRSLKGAMLRQEVYTLDGREESRRPYTVSESNYTVQLLQPRGRNRFAVFFTHPRETLVLQYERTLYEVGRGRRADPRVSHTLNLEVDAFGNVLKTVAVGYGRRFPETCPFLTDSDREKQRQILVTLRENVYTNAVTLPNSYRAPLIVSTKSYELIHCVPDARVPAVTSLFRFAELARKVAQASDRGHDLPYEDLQAEGALTPSVYRRLLDRSRTVYRSNHLDRLLGAGTLQSLALPGEQFQLTFTPGLLASVYSDKLPDPAAVLGGEGGYVDLDGDGHWWRRSGRVFFSPNAGGDPAHELTHAIDHFFLAHRYQDPFGNDTTVLYDVNRLAPVENRDTVDNVVRLENDYRVLAPFRVTDANGNRSQVAFDALGLVVGTAVMGKEGEEAGDSLVRFWADLDETTVLKHIGDPLRDPHEILGAATTRLVYDLFAYQRTGDPAVVYSLARETHEAELKPTEKTKVQHAFSYSDGFGREVQRKIQAEPGLVGGNPTRVNPRWAGSGWTAFNNKGKAVRKYEPFFSETQEFEFAVMTGVSSTLFYDPVGRVIATLHPNHTFEKTVFDPWHQESWDVNDTVLVGDPAEDPDIGSFLRRLPRADFLPTWFQERRTGALGRAEEDAAEKAARHAATPSLTFADSLGRAFLTVAHNRFERREETVEERYVSRVELDIVGRQRSVIDALGRTIVTYDYDLLGNRIRLDSADAGQRWTLNETAGNPFLTWDSRGHRTRREYDASRRPTSLLVQIADAPENLAERVVYGEGQPDDSAKNLRGRGYQQFDGAGLVTNIAYDFKGNLLRSTRQLTMNYKDEADWSHSPPLEGTVFATSTVYDALNRPVRLTSPDSSVISSTYNEANLLDRVGVNVRAAEEITPFITSISYNAKGQREVIEYGNGALTTGAYDPLTFRLTRLRTTRARDHAVLQDLVYAYDPIGNIVSIADAAQQTVYFRNNVVAAINDYVYDAIYRLIRAGGREHAGLSGQPETSSDDSPRTGHPLPGDGLALRNYQESYHYDPVGNVLEVVHTAAGGNWTRKYDYGNITFDNRLTNTSVGETIQSYGYDAHGNMTRMPHLPSMEWDFKDQLRSTRSQVVNDGTGGKTHFLYDAAGQRVRKSNEGSNGDLRRERLYLGGFEVYREYHGGAVSSVSETLHVMGEEMRVALVETRGEETTVRYQFDNHLGSVCLELDDAGAVISYEEYYPYGSTSYQAGRYAAEVGLKRYRYTGMERDNETGLNYHRARYYAPWLGRWVSPDPIGVRDSNNLYQYVSSNPVNTVDPSGLEGWDRFWGGAKMVGGVLEVVAGAGLIAAGAATSEFGIGVAIAAAGVAVTAHGADVTVSGARTMVNGAPVDTLTSQGLQGLGMSRTGANLADAGISIVGTLGANAVTRAPAAVAAVDDAARAAQPSVSLAFKAAAGPGHNMVGVNPGTGTQWSHLVVDATEESSTFVTSGTATVLPSAGPSSAYVVVEVPVTAARAEAAMASAQSQIARGAAGTYSLATNNCATYAAGVLNESGVATLPVTTPALNFVTTAVQSPQVIMPVTLVGAGVDTAVGVQTVMAGEPHSTSSADDASKVSSTSGGTQLDPAPPPYYDEAAQVCYAY